MLKKKVKSIVDYVMGIPCPELFFVYLIVIGIYLVGLFAVGVTVLGILGLI